MHKKIPIIMVVFSMLFAASIISMTDQNAASADSPIEITDSAGHQITLSSPAEHVVTMGFAFTLTVMELGGTDKIVGYDQYSTYGYNGDERMQVLEGRANLGTGYTSNKDSLITGLAQLVESGSFDKDTDVVFINNFTSTLASGGLYDSLDDLGYIVICLGASTYDGSVDVVRAISQAIGQDPAGSVNKMVDTKQTVEDKVAGIPEDERPKAMYVSVIGGTIKIYNSGLAISMIEICGAVNAGSSGTAASYSSDASGIILAAPDVVFLDGNFVGTADDFKEQYTLPSNYNVVKLDKDWNNPCPSMADGLEAVYVEIYESPLYDGDGPTSSNNGVLIAVSAIILIAIVAVAIVLVRRH